jgi:hypothetical protein
MIDRYPTLTTNRLLRRPFREEDLGADAEVTRYRGTMKQT